jgi:hypothetical protein
MVLNYAATRENCLPDKPRRALSLMGLEWFIMGPAVSVTDPFWEGADFYNRQWVAQNCKRGKGWSRGWWEFREGMVE